jgi:mannose-6-phosphate isomerase-like protein (cupin superfamily)
MRQCSHPMHPRARVRWAVVKTLDIRDLVRFSEDEPRRSASASVERLWSEVVCLQGTQGIGPLRDEASDGLLIVLAGRVAAQVGKGRARMERWESVVVPAGEDLTVRNASEEPAVLLLVAAPPPASD